MANDDDESTPSGADQDDADWEALVGKGKTSVYRPPNREKSESALHNPFLHLMLPALIIIVLGFFGLYSRNAPKPVQDETKIKALKQHMEQDIRDGTASDSELILNGIDPKEYRQKMGPLQKNLQKN